jgi:hypothetical protein
MRSGTKPFEPADVVFIETLRARNASLKAQFATAHRTQDIQDAAEIDAELQLMIDKATAELFRIADRLAARTEEGSRSWWRRLLG